MEVTSPPRITTANRSLILVQNRQVKRDAELPFVFGLIVLVARTQMNVGVLSRNLDLERGLAGGLFGERAEHIRAIGDGLPLDFSGR